MNIRTAFSTALILFGSLLSAIATSDTAEGSFGMAAAILGIALVTAIASESMRDFRQLLRVDHVMFVALYGLLYLEFLFPQPAFYGLVTPATAATGVMLVSVAFAGIAVGRHLPTGGGLFNWAQSIQLRPNALTAGLIACAFLGYAPALISVDFNPVTMIDAMVGPRFSQPWARGRLGSGADVFQEMALLTYLLPPIVGVMLARRAEFGPLQRSLAIALLLWTLFYAFSSGTRNILFVHAISLLGGYFLASRRLRLVRVVPLVAIAVVTLGIASHAMLQFRNDGLRAYWQQLRSGRTTEQPTASSNAVFVDYNLLTLSRIIEYFPESHDYLGLEVPIWAIVKPVPRALWPGKPQGLTVSIEDVRVERGASNATWSATYVGEAYMAAGVTGVAIASLLLGAIAGWWNSLLRVGDQRVYPKLLYASGLFAASLTMRSLFWMTTAILPTLALLLYGRIFLSHAATRSAGRTRVRDV